MASIALVTCVDYPALTHSDQILASALITGGDTAAAVIWDDPSVDWAAFDGIVLRSTWDYHRRPVEFARWLSDVEGTGIPLLNTPDLIRWNLDKRYLRDVAARGIRIPPTHWVARGDAVDLVAVMEERGWNEVVVKPAVSATAWRTWRVTRADAPARREQLRTEAQERDLLVQAFVPEIVAEGEWSLVYFDGNWSHAVLKQARPGDFRVQHDFGGTEALRTPPESLARQAAAVLQGLPETPTFARVDAADQHGELVLMELELIEPALFFDHLPESAARCADAIRRRVRSRDRGAVRTIPETSG